MSKPNKNQRSKDEIPDKNGEKAFKKGNAFWELRATFGREKIFKDPEIFRKACLEYFQSTDNRKWNRTEFHGKDAVKCIVPLETPYTITGLCLFLDVNTRYLEQFEKALDKDDEIDKAFSTIIAQVRNIIVTQKFEGAAVGAFNASIIQRDLGLVDRKQLDVQTEQPLFPDTSDNQEDTKDKE